MKRILIVTLCSQLLLGCVSLNKVEPEPGAEVTGLEEIVRKGQPVSMLFVHGMGVHEKTYSFGLQDQFAKELGLTFEETPVLNHDIERNGVVVGHLSIRVARSDDGLVSLRFVELTWSPLTTDAKLTLLDLESGTYKEQNPLEDRRVLLNSMAKVFINERLTDAVLYAGQLKATFNDVVAEAICALYTTSVSTLEDNRCFSDDGPSAEAHPIVLVTESLGSALVFDTLFNLNKQSGARKDAALRTAANIRAVYMLANQLPLIELTDVNGPVFKGWLDQFPCQNTNAPAVPPVRLSPLYIETEPDCPISADCPVDANRPVRDDIPVGLEAFLSIRAEILEAEQSDYYQQLQSDELEFVALSDPNDLLTYWLTERFKKSCESPGVKYTNVIVRNAQFNWLFVFANPVKAHTGFSGNESVIEFLVRGTP